MTTINEIKNTQNRACRRTDQRPEDRVMESTEAQQQ